MQHIKIRDRRIGPEQPVYIVAEISGNHNQDFDEAVRILHAAKEAGADAHENCRRILPTLSPSTVTLSPSASKGRCGRAETSTSCTGKPTRRGNGNRN